MPDLFIEIATEEMPASYLDRALAEWPEVLSKALTERSTALSR